MSVVEIGVGYGIECREGRGPLSSRELEVLRLGEKARFVQAGVFDVVGRLEALGETGALPGAIISLNIRSATIRCPS